VRLHGAALQIQLAERAAARRVPPRPLRHDDVREVEQLALSEGRTLLVLDTIAGSEAEPLYAKLGWTRAAEIPRYAGMPDGELRPTVIFYRELGPGSRTLR